MSPNTRAFLVELSENLYDMSPALHDKHLGLGVPQSFLTAVWRAPKGSRRLLCEDALKYPIHHEERK
jgi:hypothetical protein